jgi:malate synthase
MTVNRKAIADELADQSKRRKKLIEGAIADAALDPPDLRMTTEQLRYALEAAAERWANAVNRDLPLKFHPVAIRASAVDTPFGAV